jgi:serine/threonine protein kinase
VAIKQIDLSSLEKGDDITAKFGEFRREVLLMSGLEHPNIVALKGICLKPFCMITEYLPHGDLKKYLDNPINEVRNN